MSGKGGDDDATVVVPHGRYRIKIVVDEERGDVEEIREEAPGERTGVVLNEGQPTRTTTPSIRNSHKVRTRGRGRRRTESPKDAKSKQQRGGLSPRILGKMSFRRAIDAVRCRVPGEESEEERRLLVQLPTYAKVPTSFDITRQASPKQQAEERDPKAKLLSIGQREVVSSDHAVVDRSKGIEQENAVGEVQKHAPSNGAREAAAVLRNQTSSSIGSEQGTLPISAETGSPAKNADDDDSPQGEARESDSTSFKVDVVAESGATSLGGSHQEEKNDSHSTCMGSKSTSDAPQYEAGEEIRRNQWIQTETNALDNGSRADSHVDDRSDSDSAAGESTYSDSSTFSEDSEESGADSFSEYSEKDDLSFKDNGSVSPPYVIYEMESDVTGPTLASKHNEGNEDDTDNDSSVELFEYKKGRYLIDI